MGSPAAAFPRGRENLRQWPRHSFTAPAHDRRQGPCQYLKIKKQVPAMDVVEIESNTAPKRGVSTCGHLPQACQAWGAVQTMEVSRLIACDIVERMGPRPHQAHFTAQNIPKLGQFVQAVASEPTTEARHPGIVVQLEECAGALIAPDAR